MLPIPDNFGYRSRASAAAFTVCLLAAGCAGEHLFRAQDRKIEELRLERARQDEALGRTRESIEQLREEWKSFAARENTASKETAALQGAIRKLAQRVEEIDGKRSKLEERLHLAETKSTELNQAFTQVSSMLKAAEGDLIALRSSRAAMSGAAFAGTGREGVGRLPGDPSNAVDASRGSGAAGSMIDGILPGRGSLGIVFGAVLLAAGVLVALVCVHIGARLRPATSGRGPQPENEHGKKHEKEQGKERGKENDKAAAKQQAEPAQVDAQPEAQAKEAPSAPDPPPAAPPAARVPAAPARLVFPTNVVDDFFDAAENASARFAKDTSTDALSTTQPPTEQLTQNTQLIDSAAGDELSNTDVIPMPGKEEPDQRETVVVSVNSRARQLRKNTETRTQTEILPDADAPGRTQVIGEGEDRPPAPKEARPSPSTRDILAGKQTPRSPAAALQKKTKAPDEKDLLDELENIIGYKMGEKSV